MTEEAMGIEFMDENNIPRCAHCGSTRGLHHCADCTDCGDGVEPVCAVCLPAVRADRECEAWEALPESFRYGMRLSEVPIVTKQTVCDCHICRVRLYCDHCQKRLIFRDGKRVCITAGCPAAEKTR